MISPRRLVAFLLLTSVSLAVILPFAGVGLVWAVCAPLLIVFAFVASYSGRIESEDLALPGSLVLRVVSDRAPPLS